MFLNFLTTYIGKLINKKHVKWVGYNTLKHHIQWNQSLIKNYKIILKIEYKKVAHSNNHIEKNVQKYQSS